MQFDKRIKIYSRNHHKILRKPSFALSLFNVFVLDLAHYDAPDNFIRVSRDAMCMGHYKVYDPNHCE